MEFVYLYIYLVVGVDEVGCGFLVGVVVIVVVIFDLVKLIVGLNDFKKFSEKCCLVLFDEIKEKVLCWSLGCVELYEIDELNILYVIMLVMQCVVVGLSIVFEFVLIDGNCCLLLLMFFQVVVKGDSWVVEISVVFILVKVICDVEMVMLDFVFFYYGFVQYKGYFIVVYLQKLQEYGVIEYYWCSFGLVKCVLGLVFN